MTDSSGPSQHLVFLIGDDEHAFAVSHLQEVAAHRPITRLPGMPAWIRGIITLHGRVLPVIDLAIRFGRAESAIGKRTCFLVVDLDIDGERTPMALLVDAVSRVLDVAAGDVEAAPSFGTRIRVDFLQGVLRSGDRFIVLLDLSRIFAPEEVLDVSQRVAAAPAVNLPPPAHEPLGQAATIPASLSDGSSGVVLFDD